MARWQFLNSFSELYLSFCSEYLDNNGSLTIAHLLWFLFLLFCFLTVIPSIQNFRKNEHTQKHQDRAKRRRKGGTLTDWRHCQREEEDIKTLVSILKSPLGQHHDTIHFRQLLCPDPSCGVCNSATAEIDRMLFSLALEDTTPSVPPLASTAPVTEPSFTQPSAFSTGDLILPPLPGPFLPPPSKLLPNTVTPLGDYLSSSPPVHSLAQDPFPLLESEFPVHDFPSQSLAFPSLLPHDTQSAETTLTLNTIFLDTSIIQEINSNSSIIEDINPLRDLAQTLNPTELVAPHVTPVLSVSPSSDYCLTLTQPISNYISSKRVLENSSPDSTGVLSTYVPQGTDHPSLSITESSCKESDAKDSLLSTLETSDKDVGYESKKVLDVYKTNQSGENSKVSWQSVSQRQLENVLKVHLSKKHEETDEGWLPTTVHRSWHAIQERVSVKSQTEIRQKSLRPSVGRGYCLNTSQRLSFLEPSVQQMLETHIIKLSIGMSWGLTTKVFESIETSFNPLFNSSFSSSNNLILEVNSKSRGFTPLRGSSKSLHGDNTGTANSAVILNHPLPATSLVSKEGQRTLRRSPSNIKHEILEEGQRIQDSRDTLLPVTNSNIGKASPIPNICSPKLHTRQARAGPVTEGQSVNSSDQIKMGQSKNIKKSEPVSTPSVSRDEKLDGLQSKTSDVLTTSKLRISQRINAYESKGETTVTTESPPAKISIVQHIKSPDLRKQFNAGHSQAQGQLTSHSSGSLPYKASLTHAQGVSSVDMEASQVLHAHLENRGVSMEQQQETWVPKNILRLCQNKNFPPVAKKVSPIGSKSEDFGGEDAVLGTAQPRRFPTQNVALEETLGSKSPQTISQKRQSSSESLFKSKMNHFFQWVHLRIKCKKQENSQEKGSLTSSAKSRGSVKCKAAFTGKFLEEKLGHQHAIAITCPQESLLSAVKFGKAQQKSAVRAQAAPIHGHPFNFRAPFYKVANTKDRNLQNSLALKDQLSGQKYHQPVAHRGTVLYLSPTCRLPAARGLPTALTTAEGTVFRDQSLFRQKIILTKARGKNFPHPNNSFLVENIDFS